MEGLAQACAQAHFGDVVDAPHASLESEVNVALHVACTSINHVGSVAIGIASQSTVLRYALLAEEDCGISSLASAKRRANWMRGRVAARIALGKLGTAQGAVGRGKAGEPIWPHGISGSITHCLPWSVAAVTESSSSVFLGIDLEDTKRIQEFGIENVVCRPAEREWVHEDSNSLERLCRIFSAKEALYKSLFPSFGHYIDFDEVELCWSGEQCGFQVVTLPCQNGPEGRVSLIASRRSKNLIFSCAVYATRRVSPSRAEPIPHSSSL